MGTEQAEVVGERSVGQVIRRRERVIRIFPNRESAVCLLGAVLMEQHEQWTTGYHYLDMTAYWQWRHSHHAHGSAEVSMQIA